MALLTMALLTMALLTMALLALLALLLKLLLALLLAPLLLTTGLLWRSHHSRSRQSRATQRDSMRCSGSRWIPKRSPARTFSFSRPTLSSRTISIRRLASTCSSFHVVCASMSPRLSPPRTLACSAPWTDSPPSLPPSCAVPRPVSWAWIAVEPSALCLTSYGN